jgi:hypothetical protein
MKMTRTCSNRSRRTCRWNNGRPHLCYSVDLSSLASGSSKRYVWRTISASSVGAPTGVSSNKAWKKKTRISRWAQSNLPDINSTKTPASGFVPPEVSHGTHSQSTQRDELEPVNISQTDGDIAESNHIEGHSSPGSKSGGAEVLQASASKPFTASGSTGEKWFKLGT